MVGVRLHRRSGSELEESDEARKEEGFEDIQQQQYTCDVPHREIESIYRARMGVRQRSEWLLCRRRDGGCNHYLATNSDEPPHRVVAAKPDVITSKLLTWRQLNRVTTADG